MRYLNTDVILLLPWGPRVEVNASSALSKSSSISLRVSVSSALVFINGTSFLKFHCWPPLEGANVNVRPFYIGERSVD
jgi:hypothetical protein